MANVSKEQQRYDYIVVGAGAAGSVLAGELAASGAQVLVIESGGPDDAATIMNPSIWFYNVGGPLDYHLPIAPSPPIKQSQIQYGPRPRPWWRHQHKCHGVDARNATGL
jgi:choline dehydrogenase